MYKVHLEFYQTEEDIINNKVTVIITPTEMRDYFLKMYEEQLKNLEEILKNLK